MKVSLTLMKLGGIVILCSRNLMAIGASCILQFSLNELFVYCLIHFMILLFVHNLFSNWFVLFVSKELMDS